MSLSNIGMIGMDVCVTLKRPGFRIKKRRIKPKKVGKTHKISREDAMQWAKIDLGVEVRERDD